MSVALAYSNPPVGGPRSMGDLLGIVVDEKNASTPEVAGLVIILALVSFGVLCPIAMVVLVYSKWTRRKRR